MASKKAAPKSRKIRKKADNGARSPGGGEEAPYLPPGLSFPVVAIGASAGGLAAFTELLKALPPETGMAFVLIQHLEPKHESALTSLLSKATIMPVAEVSDGMAVEPDRVYVIPPNKDMTIRKGVLRLTPRSSASGLQRPIDDFLVALAEEQGDAAIGAVLSGTGSDGTYGLKAIKAAGGMTFAQDPKTAQWPAMPLSAITAGSVDFVFPPKRIAAELARISRHPYLAEAREVPEGSDLDKVCIILRSAVGIDFRLYKQATLRRRLARRMALQKIASLARYAQILKQNPDEAQAMADDVFIHVTGFFRTAESFQALRKQVLAKMGPKRHAEDPIRIWVPGCSTGEEVYSIAMLLLEELGERADRIKVQFFGTDIQERAVEQARAGVYTAAAVAGVSPARLKRFFVKTDQGYQIQKSVRDLCVFARHDLAKDPPFSRLDLLSCRNVLIYMGQSLQKRAFSMFQYALKPGGFLFLGNSESIGSHSDAFTSQDPKHRIFLRKAAASAFHEPRPIPDFPREQAPAPLKAMTPSLAIDFRKEAEGVLLEQYAPSALIVDPDLHIVHFQGDLSPYLGPPTGQPSFHLLKMVRPEFVVDLRSAIYKSRREGRAVHIDEVPFQREGRPAAVRLEVRPLKRRNGKKQNLLVVFQKLEPASPEEKRKLGRTGAQRRTTERTERSEQELVSLREHLRTLVSEHEAAQEEMKAANEEIQSSNEELQSTNEELETAKEELQSANEELVTLNDELQHRNDELTVLTHDLSNLLVGVDIPVLVLDADLRVRRFTPVAGALLNLIPGDVGRPFSDIASSLDVGDWNELFADVIDQGRLIEREVHDKAGHRYSLRVRPYKTSGNKIEGVLVVMLDTDLISRARDKAHDQALEAEQRSDSILNSLTAQVCVLSPDGTVVAANDAWNRFVLENGSHWMSAAGVGANYLQAYGRAAAEGVFDAKTADGIQEVLKGRRGPFELEYVYQLSGGRRWFSIHVSPLIESGSGAVIAHMEITERKLAEIAAIAERTRLQQAAQARAQEVQALAARLLTAQEEERRRVSRELHDEICQQLASLAIDIGGLEANLQLPEAAQRQLREIQERVVKASEEARHIAYALHPAMLDDLGLVASLRDLCSQFSERNPDMQLEFNCDATRIEMPREVASCLYRVTQEGLQNVAKHSSAAHASVVLAVGKRAVLLTIADDGAGFDRRSVHERGGLGLIGMEERAQLINGKLTIVSKPDHGTRITLEVPMRCGRS